MLEEKTKDLGDTTLYTGETYVRKKKNIEHSTNKKKERKSSAACVSSPSKLAE